jgi:two-component system, cell cycle sensor histidine kinase PleC
MAPAQVASASNADSIKGLAQSIAKPAYRRLLGAEAVLRRAVPVLIVTFLVIVTIGAGLQVFARRQRAVAGASAALELLADQVAERLDRTKGDGQAQITREVEEALVPLIGRLSFRQRQILVTDARGAVIAMLPRRRLDGRRLIDVLGAEQLLVAFAGRDAVQAIILPDGSEVFATVRPLKAPLGHLAIVESSDFALADWRADATLTVTLSVTTSFVLLILGFAFHWQGARSREADLIHDTVRRRVDAALNRGRCGLWDWDLASGRIFWSESMFAILGLEVRDDLLAFGDVNKLVHSQDVDLYALAAELADGNTTSIDRNFRMRHARGDWIWLRVRCEIIGRPRDDVGLHLIGIAVDITEQKSLVERTMAADLRLRDAIETIPEAFVLWDAENRLVLCNSNFQQLHNLSDDAIKAGTSYEAVLAAGRQHVIRTVVNESGSSVQGARTFEAQLEDGRWLQISERRTKDGGYVSVGTDITAIKRHEGKLMESERRLIATIADLRASQQALQTQARQLAELAEKYSEEKTRAEEANNAKSKFLANMSHELRTPLNAIIGFSEIMEARLFGPLGVDRYNEYCHDIRESGQYLLDVINDILDMSRIEAGRMRLDFEAVEVDRILSEAIRVISQRAQKKSLTINSRIADGLKLHADRRALKQIALNLLSNAVKFTPDGGEVRVHARKTSRDVVIAIADTGIGIPRPALTKLCRPFEQVEDYFTKSHQGSGLGLAISKSLIELHRGTIRIRSTPSKGTVVVLRLPAKMREEQLPLQIDYDWSRRLQPSEKSTTRH